jgi:hypothetical protein
LFFPFLFSLLFIPGLKVLRKAIWPATRRVIFGYSEPQAKHGQ